MVLLIHPEIPLEASSSDFIIPKFNSKVKFTPVMEEVLLCLLVFFVLSGETKMTNIVGKLSRLLNRSPNAIGSSLSSLAKLQLLLYNREGKGMTVMLLLGNKFLFSLLVRFFGLSNSFFENETIEDFLNINMGFIPLTNDCQKIIQCFQEKNSLLQSKINELQEWMNWINELKEIECLVITPENKEQLSSRNQQTNPFRQLSRKIVSQIKKRESEQIMPISVEQLTEIVNIFLQQNQVFPPWKNSLYLQQQRSPLLINLEEE